ETKQRGPRAPGPLLCRFGGVRDDGKSIDLEREGDLRLAASVFWQIGFPGIPTVTPVEDDLETVLGTKRRLESRDEERARERHTGDDAQASRLSCHQGFRVTRIISPTQILCAVKVVPELSDVAPGLRFGAGHGDDVLERDEVDRVGHAGEEAEPEDRLGRLALIALARRDDPNLLIVAAELAHDVAAIETVGLGLDDDEIRPPRST